MKVKYYLKKVDGLTVPMRANPHDAGYDITATSDPIIVGAKPPESNVFASVHYIEYETNLYFVPESPDFKFEGSTVKFADFQTLGYIGANFHTDVRPRSSISSKTNLVLANSIGLIDRGYMNQVLIRFRYVWQPEDLLVTITSDMIPTGDQAIVARRLNGTVNPERLYKKGDRIAQMLPVQTHDIEFELVDELPGIDRGGGFGSTGEAGAPSKA
jgi:dUTPase